MRQKSNIEWGNCIFIIGYHIALLIGLPFFFMYFSPSWPIYVSMVVLLYMTGLSITTGYHRYYSHKTFKTNKFLEVIFLFFGTMSTQGSALKWAHDHRLHHAYVDTDRDPYSIKKGFMHAHLFWMFRKTDPMDKKVVSDLYRNKLLVFQHRFYVPLMFLTNSLAFLFVGYVFNDYLAAFILCWWVRLFFLHHFTWFINSLAHTWGSQSFSQEHSAVDNYLISLVTFGEGYHNFHHTFANDYRNGTKWYHFDPSKWIIWALSKFKLTYGLKKTSFIRIRERMVNERKNELKEKIAQCWFLNKKNLEEKIEKISDDLTQHLSEIYKLLREYRNCKKNDPQLLKLKQKIKTLQRDFKNEWKAWKRFSKTIIHLKPLSIH